jgi:hypothetical protein
MKRGPQRDRTDDWALTSLYALVVAIVVGASALGTAHRSPGYLAAASYFALLSLALYLQGLRVRKRPRAPVARWLLHFAIPLAFAAGACLVVIGLLSNGRL